MILCGGLAECNLGATEDYEYFHQWHLLHLLKGGHKFAFPAVVYLSEQLAEILTENMLFVGSEYSAYVIYPVIIIFKSRSPHFKPIIERMKS